MRELLSISILPVALTLLAYQAGVAIQKKIRSPLCNPLLIAVVLVLLFLKLTGMELTGYQSGAASISWLMTPATISLAVSMYEQFQVLRKNIRGIVLGVAAGGISCLVMILVFCLAAGFDRELTISLLPKSITTAIGAPLSETIGGIPSVTTAAIILTGISANILGASLCRFFRLTDEIAQGAAFGTSGHVIGTAKATELSPLTGAVSSLSLVTAGLLTALVLPVLTQFL